MQEKQQMLCDLYKETTIDKSMQLINNSIQSGINEGIRIGRLEMRAEMLDAIVKHEGSKEELITILKEIKWNTGT